MESCCTQSRYRELFWMSQQMDASCTFFLVVVTTVRLSNSILYATSVILTLVDPNRKRGVTTSSSQTEYDASEVSN
jgi:hypothetical protein